MVCFGVSAAERNPQDSCMTFFSPDTDVLILVIANYDRLPKITSVSMASNVNNYRTNMDSSRTREGKGFSGTA